MGGHYTAFASSSGGSDSSGAGGGGAWFCFDDHRVSPIPEASVVSPAAYVLFYVRREPSKHSE